MSIVRSRSPKYSLLHIYVVLGRSTQHDAHLYAAHRTWLFISYDSYALVDERIVFYYSDLHSQSYHRVLLGSSGGMSVLHLMILHPISATASNTESAMSSLAAPFRMRSVS